MSYPLMDRFGISSPYGPRPNLMGDFHYGTDMPCPIGTDIPCVKEGTVVLADWIYFTVGGTNYKELVCIVNRPDGRFNIYDHLSQVFVKKGDKVSKGQIIAKSGASGYVTGPHLHLQQSIGQYTGGLFANYKTENLEPELRAWTLQGGRSEDMDTRKAVQDLAMVTGGRPMPQDVEDQKVSYIEGGGSWAQLYKDLLEFSNNYISGNRVVGSIYSAAGYNPGQAVVDAKVGALAGGFPVSQLISEVLPKQDTSGIEGQLNQCTSQVTSLTGKLADATVDAFKQAYLTRAGEYPTKTQVDDWQHSQADIPSWVNTYAPSKAEKDLQSQLDQQTTALATFQTATQQEMKVKDLTISRLEDQLAGKTRQSPVEPVPGDDSGIVFSPEPEPEKKSGSVFGWIIDIIKAIFGGK